MLENLRLPDLLVSLAVKGHAAAHGDEVDHCRAMMETIQDIQEPLKESEEAVDVGLEGRYEADDVTGIQTGLEEALRSLGVALEMADATMETRLRTEVGALQQLLKRAEVLSDEEIAARYVARGVQIAAGVLQHFTLPSLPAEVRGLLDSIIIPAATHEMPLLRCEGVKALGYYCLRDVAQAEMHMSLLARAMVTSGEAVDVRIAALQAVGDALLCFAPHRLGYTSDPQMLPHAVAEALCGLMAVTLAVEDDALASSETGDIAVPFLEQALREQWGHQDARLRGVAAQALAKMLYLGRLQGTTWPVSDEAGLYNTEYTPEQLVTATALRVFFQPASVDEAALIQDACMLCEFEGVEVHMPCEDEEEEVARQEVLELVEEMKAAELSSRQLLAITFPVMVEARPSFRCVLARAADLAVRGLVAACEAEAAEASSGRSKKIVLDATHKLAIEKSAQFSLFMSAAGVADTTVALPRAGADAGVGAAEVAAAEAMREHYSLAMRFGQMIWDDVKGTCLSGRAL